MELPADIQIRQVTLDDAPAEAWATVLDAEEQARAAAFPLEKRRRAFVMGRVAARTLLAEQLQTAPARVALHVAADGAVEVAGTDLHLSIAHSGEQAVAAVGARPLGVDLEQIAPRHPELYRFMLHEAEYPLLERLPLPPEERVILCWTLKEATLKALRTGLRLSPKRLRLEVDPGRAAARVHVDQQGTFEARYEARGGYYLAVAFRASR